MSAVTRARTNQPAGTRERAAERRVKALALRQAGLSFRLIGQRLGVSGKTAFKDVDTALAELAHEQRLAVERLVALEDARLDEYLLAVTPQARTGDLAAIDRALRISESRRKLHGLDAPGKLEHAGMIDVRVLSDADLERLAHGEGPGGVGVAPPASPAADGLHHA